MTPPVKKSNYYSSLEVNSKLPTHEMFLENVIFTVLFHCRSGLEEKGNYQLKANLKGKF